MSGGNAIELNKIESFAQPPHQITPSAQKRKTNRAGRAPVGRPGRAGTWMVLTMRPDRRKSRPSGSTTSTSGTAMAGRRRSRRGQSDGRRRWKSSPRRSFSGDRWAVAGGSAGDEEDGAREADSEGFFFLL